MSNIGDDWAGKFPQKWPQFNPPPAQFELIQGASKAEVEALRKEVMELKELLKAAKKFDAATGQPDCEMDAKVKLIKEIAKLVGVELGDVFGAKDPTAQP